jgi:S-adenosylmethionine decarboxylase proenzyme
MHLGRQLILELYNCNPTKLSDPKLIETEMRHAALAMNATIVTATFHHFSPLGVSGVVVIQESHLTIHTWPEHGYAAIDIFTCGEIDMGAGSSYLATVLEAKKQEERTLVRGQHLLDAVSK